MSSQEKTILIVDDSPSVRVLLADMLEEEGYKVVEAVDGFEAFKMVEYLKFDLIITDLSMPVMDGIEFIRLAKKQPLCRFVPIVVLSSEEDSRKVDAAKAAGASTYLSKPFKAPQLRAMLQVVLGR
jgi:two-component system, chemotaxis family, chemotaxis protein CheY